MLASTLFWCFLLVASAAELHEYRSFNGTKNNLKFPEYGLPNRPCIRIGKANYEDGVDEMVMTPNARTISNAMAALAANSTPDFNFKRVNELHPMFRMFVMLDVFNIQNGNEQVKVNIDKGDPYFDKTATGTQTMAFQRSNFEISDKARIPINTNTGFLDGSSLYGQSKAASDALRTMNGGLLRVNVDNTLPINVAGINLEMENININPDIPPLCPADRLRASGTSSVNYTPESLMVHTLFVREHNRLAAEFQTANPDWDDETLFQEARRWNIAQIQRTVDREFLAPLLGKPVSPPYSGYNENIDPMVTNFFASVAFKYAHSELNEIALRIGNNFLEVKERHLPRRDAFFNPDKALEAGIEPLFRGMVSQTVRSVSPSTIDAYRNFLNSNPAGTVGLDQVFLDIMRARDHGVPFYNDCRRFYNLEPHADFSFISDKNLADTLTKLYGEPENADAIVVAMAEPKMDGASVGELIGASISDQFRRIRDGDRFWYENPGVLNPIELEIIQKTPFYFLLLRNLADVTMLPQFSVFFDYSDDISSSQSQPLVFPLSTEYYPQSFLMQEDFLLSWKVNDDTKEVEFLAQARNLVGLGWVGVGFALDSANTLGSGMVGVDIVIGTIKDDAPEVRDYYVRTFGNPELDTDLEGSDDLKNTSFYVLGNFAILSFTRPLIAVDSKLDVSFQPNELIRVLYAMGNSFTIPSYHAHMKGSQNVKINKIVISLSESYGPALITISSVISVGVLAFFALILIHKDNVVIKASGWKFSLVVLLGILFCLITVIVNVSLPSLFVCTSRRVLLPLGLSTIFASLAVTQWRLHMIFNAIGVKRVIGLSDTHLFTITSLSLLGNVVIIIIWSMLSPVSLIQNNTIEGLITLSCSGLNDRPFVVTMYIYNALIILNATVFTYFNRNLTSTFNETSNIGNVVYNSVAVTFLMVLVNGISQMAEATSDILNSIAILYAVVFALAVLFGKKIWRVYHPVLEKKSSFLSDPEQAPSRPSFSAGSVSLSRTANATQKSILKDKAIMNENGNEKEVYIYGLDEIKMLLIQDVKNQTTQAFTNQEINSSYDANEVEAPETALNVKIGSANFSLRFHDSKTSRKWREYFFASFGKQGILKGTGV